MTATLLRKTPVIDNVICPDGEFRQFTVQNRKGDNKANGFVRIRGISVSGKASRKSERYRWRFIPNLDGKNAHLMRIESLPVGQEVRVEDPSIPESLRRYRGTITATEYDGCYPVYHVTFTRSGRITPRLISHEYVKAVS